MYLLLLHYFLSSALSALSLRNLSCRETQSSVFQQQYASGNPGCCCIFHVIRCQSLLYCEGELQPRKILKEKISAHPDSLLYTLHCLFPVSPFPEPFRPQYFSWRNSCVENCFYLSWNGFLGQHARDQHLFPYHRRMVSGMSYSVVSDLSIASIFYDKKWKVLFYHRYRDLFDCFISLRFLRPHPYELLPEGLRVRNRYDDWLLSWKIQS